MLNERRQNYENRPYGFAGMSIVAALPPEHPYHWMTIGAAEDLKAARLEDVRAFFQTYYRPRNASLSIAGDIDADRAVALATDYFGDSEPGPEPPPVVAPKAALAGETRLVLEDRVELSRLYLAWHSPALFAEDDAELDLVSEVLGGGKTSRLYRSLVYEQRIATEIAASQGSRELGSFFQIVATAAPGRSLAEVERAIATELARFLENGPTADELERCLAQAEAHFLHRLQTVGGFGGKSDQLNAYNVYLGTLGISSRICRDIALPMGRSEARRGAMAVNRPRRAERRAPWPRGAGARRFATGVRVLMSVNRSRLPPPGPEPHFAFPEIRHRKLSNGLDAWTALHREVPLVSVLVVIRAGAALDPADRPGLAALTGDLLDEGCGGLDALALHETLGRLGAQLETEVGADATLVGLTTLERSATPALTLLAEMITRPSLEASDFDRVRDLRLNRLLQLRDMPPAIAERVFTERLTARTLWPPADWHRSIAAGDGPRRGANVSPTAVSPATGDRHRRRERARGRPRRARRFDRGGVRKLDVRYVRGQPERRRGPVRCGREERAGYSAAGRCAAVRAADWSCGCGSNVARLSRARRTQSGARWPVRQPDQLEPARAQGLHLRRAHQLRVQARSRSSLQASVGGRHRRRSPRGAG